MAIVQSIERAFVLLEFLSDYPDGMKITTLANESGLSKSTVHRLLSTLIELNYVKQNRVTEEYQISFKALYLTRNILSSSPLISTANPILHKLVDDINETVHLCIENDEKIIYIDKIKSNQPIQMSSKIGSTAPMYCTGIGKMLLSDTENTVLDDIISRISFIKRTENTITTSKDFKVEIQKIRSQGYALDNIENENEIRCIAAPIYDYTGRIIASFSVSGLSTHITLERIEESLANQLLKAAQEISLQLGYSGEKFHK
ncbi:IclR family transcriptional regulator [Kurthia sibirica]|uniref:Glycerol operon regulatory protein n=1 Tax=Kurthia sibirica TaxID=202750 RepID=A0A2U3AI27_9BACL|nr:IclR family transcriptional regulator [Kurthia sibirica]PWI24198.1 IclR family transcriptional regulator [Kurthia sibirica]GEK34818.1 IclR family transcriptional regulator [Kurthia sibirica]